MKRKRTLLQGFTASSSSSVPSLLTSTSAVSSTKHIRVIATESSSSSSVSRQNQKDEEDENTDDSWLTADLPSDTALAFASIRNSFSTIVVSKLRRGRASLLIDDTTNVVAQQRKLEVLCGIPAVCVSFLKGTPSLTSSGKLRVDTELNAWIKAKERQQHDTRGYGGSISAAQSSSRLLKLPCADDDYVVTLLEDLQNYIDAKRRRRGNGGGGGSNARRSSGATTKVTKRVPSLENNVAAASASSTPNHQNDDIDDDTDDDGDGDIQSALDFYAFMATRFPFVLSLSRQSVNEGFLDWSRQGRPQNTLITRSAGGGAGGGGISGDVSISSTNNNNNNNKSLAATTTTSAPTSPPSITSSISSTSSTQTGTVSATTASLLARPLDVILRVLIQLGLFVRRYDDDSSIGTYVAPPPSSASSASSFFSSSSSGGSGGTSVIRDNNPRSSYTVLHPSSSSSSSSSSTKAPAPSTSSTSLVSEPGGTGFWFGVPEAGRFVTYLREGRIEICQKLSKKPYSECSRDEFVKQTKLTRSAISTELHVRDAVGKGFMTEVQTARGIFLRVSGGGR